ncbi:MAG: EAL domain-containing protein [Defluviitaleaceae bacterium]|nr:EAL domain-containing protein [Defluviitaleaceae bacterium]
MDKNALILEGAAKYNYVYDFELDTFTFNDAFAQDMDLYSTTMENGIDWLLTATVDDLDKDELLHAFSTIKEGEADVFDFKARILDHFTNSIRWLHFRGKYGRDESGKALMLAGSITETTNDEKRYELNKLIIQGSAQCAFVFDLTKDVYEFSAEILDLIPILTRKFKNGRDTWLAHVLPNDRDFFTTSLEKVISGETDRFKTQMRINDKDGNPIWISLMGKAARGEIGNHLIIAGSLINLQDMEFFSNHIQKPDNAHKMSGLPNRSLFLQHCDDLIAKDEDNFGGKGGFVILIDIDNFSAINSIHGLHTGDRIMAEYGNILAGLLSEKEQLYHFGNNLFAISSTGQDKAHAQWLCKAIPMISGGGMAFGDAFVKMTVSIGVADFAAGEMPTDILMNAEMALNKAKEQKDTVEHYKAHYREAHTRRLSLETALMNSIEADFAGFEVFYQPLYSVAHNMFVGAEALLRWRNGEGQIISPAEVIPALQDLGVFHRVESWVFSTAARQCAIWKKLTKNEEFTININMSPQRAASGSMVEEMVDAMRTNSLSLANIYLELTEESVVVSAQGGESILGELRELGTRIALDDFGTGYSSLGHLRSLPICKLKIDRTFVKDIETDTIGKDFLGALINLAHIMNYVVCAEGVETLAQARILAEMGTEYLQGFYFSRPLPASELEQNFLMDNDSPQTFTRWFEEIWGHRQFLREENNWTSNKPKPFMS